MYATPLPPRVLVCSDDVSVVRELTQQAQALFVRFTVAKPHELLGQARLLQPDMIILDAKGAIDGRLLLAMLKQDMRTCGLRVAMLSDAPDERLHRFCREQRALHLQAKPLPSDYLATLIQVRASSGWVALRSA